MRLEVEGLCWAAGGRAILRDVSFSVKPGSFAGLIGPNGGGKTSVLRCAYRLQRPSSGVVRLDGRDVWAMAGRELAQRLAAVVQEAPGETGYTSWEMVQLGRAPHKRLTERLSRADDTLVADALLEVSAGDLADRQFSTLSGGEKQRVLLARALVQQPRCLVLDEPTNHLDIRFQLEVLGIVRRLGVTVVAALHDLNLAAAFCDQIVVLDGGQVVADGRPEEVLTTELLAQVYGVDTDVSVHPSTGRLNVTYLPGRFGDGLPPTGRLAVAGEPEPR